MLMTGHALLPDGQTRGSRWRAGLAAMLALLLAACGANQDAAAPGQPAPADGKAGEGRASVTISGDDQLADALTWRIPPVQVATEGRGHAGGRAVAALGEGRLHEDADAAIPLYLAIQRLAPDDARAGRGLDRALTALLRRGDEQLALAGEDEAALRHAHALAAVARTVAPDDAEVRSYLERVDLTDRLWTLNAAAEADLRDGRDGAQGGGALAGFREVLRLQPDQPRALQGVAAVESGLIRNAELAAERGEFQAAARWIELAARVRPGSDTIADARERVDAVRRQRIAQLRDAGLRLLPEYNGVRKARDQLAELLRIAEPGDPAATELRTRIDLATHYGLFRPGQVFTDALQNGGRGPQMIVVPHGAFRMGAEADAI